MVEELFNSIKNTFTALSNKIENINVIIEKIGANVNESMREISTEIENLTNTLDRLMNVSDLKNLMGSLHGIVETFRTQLQPEKVQKLLTDLSQSVKNLKEKA